MSGRHALVLALAMLVLTACAPQPFKSPRVVAAGPAAVSIEAGKARRPDATAERECAKFGRSARFAGKTDLSGDEVTSLFGYNCVDNDP